MITALLITGMVWGFVLVVVGVVSAVYSWWEESWHPLVEAGTHWWKCVEPFSSPRS